MKSRRASLSDDEFHRLLAFRDGLRRFLRWSEDQARAVGLTGVQHQLLLAVRGHPAPPSIGDIAEHLLLRHHTVVELVDRVVRAGLVQRYHDHDDQRIVLVRLTKAGEEKLSALTATHLEELARLRSQHRALWDQLPGPPATSRHPGVARQPDPGGL